MLKFMLFTIMVLGFVKFQISVALRPTGFRLIMSTNGSGPPLHAVTLCYTAEGLPSTLQLGLK
jgi:hypothetical protein